eukprot:Plantae.Rhodophyta-Hildenbrandia_rubra.ctg14531.p1 GENE.Plantae.Rhodophyta-Hildenbrandia_rubra.ctg14531~~Plantae.Rhodophyta-Hildenbrandia_rubra.ctg14531.p1  ORF type:complete len:269 (-),score=87.65 Plantae.Rhodophyta-Hildenbrandia_rubra.ctg14531:274-1080(-)
MSGGDDDVSGKSVLIIGGNKGLGLSVVDEFAERGVGKLYVGYRSEKEESEKHFDEVKNLNRKSGLDWTKEESYDELWKWLEDVKVDIVVCVAGLFTKDKFGDVDVEGLRKMFEICSVSPLRIVEGLVNRSILKKDGGKVALITSEGGSIGIRSEKEGGGNYGHHMSKAAENMMGRLLAWDLKERGIAVVMLHPGFMKSSMTEDFKDLYDELGAVETSEAAKGVVDAVEKLKLEKTGRFVQPLGSKHLGFGLWGLDDPDKRGPFSELPF